MTREVTLVESKTLLESDIIAGALLTSALSSTRVGRRACDTIWKIGINAAGKRVASSKHLTLVGGSRALNSVNRVTASIDAALRRKDALINETALKTHVGCVCALIQSGITDINCASIEVVT